MPALSKDAILEICRREWNTFDPIGVVPLGVDDEYESYVTPLAALLLRNAGRAEIVQWVAYIVREHMGLDGYPMSKIELFVDRIVEATCPPRRKH